MDRRESIRDSAIAVAAMAAAPLVASPLVKQEQKKMKKVVIIDGGPRKNWNTAQLLHKAQEGAESIGAEVEYISLYGLKYSGCRSCMACKRKEIGRAHV